MCNLLNPLGVQSVEMGGVDADVGDLEGGGVGSGRGADVMW